MNQHAGVRQGVGGALQFELRLADFHAFAFGQIEDAARFINTGDQFVDARPHHAGRRKTFVAISVAIDAKRALLRPDQRVIRFEDRVIAVTSDALAKLFVIERFLVRTRLKQFRLPRMTLAADIRDRRDARRRGAVIAMTVVARRRRQILLHVNRVGVDAGLVFRVLVARNAKRLHVIGARMTLRAGFGDVRRIDR